MPEFTVARALAKKVAAEALAARAEQTDAERRFPRENIDALAQVGLLALILPPEQGGLGAGPVAFAQVTEELAQACGSTAMVYVMHICGTACLLARQTPFVAAECLPYVAQGRALATLAFSEFGSGAHFYAPVSQVVQNNGHYTLNCDKSFVTSAGEADLYIVSSRSAAATSPMESDLFVVTREQARARAELGAAWMGMGLNGNASSSMKFRGCTIPASQMLGKPGDGLSLMLEVVLPVFSIGVASVNVGLAEAALQGSIQHATSRRYEHTGRSLAEIETIQHLIAEMKLSIDRTRAFLQTTAQMVEGKDPNAMLPVLEVKAAACETALEVTSKAMRVCGGAAYSKRVPVERYFRDSQAGNVMAPTTDILKGFIGKAILGLPLFG